MLVVGYLLLTFSNHSRYAFGNPYFVACAMAVSRTNGKTASNSARVVGMIAVCSPVQAFVSQLAMAEPRGGRGVLCLI